MGGRGDIIVGTNECDGDVGGLKSVERLDYLDVVEPLPSEEVVAVPLPAVPSGETGRKPSCPLFEQH